MFELGRRKLSWLALAAIVAGAAYLLLGHSDQRDILRSLQEICAAASSQRGDTEGARRRRLERALRERATQSVVLSAPELGAVTGASAIADSLEPLGSAELSVTIEQSEVRVQAERAQASLLVEFRVHWPGEERIERRGVTADLVRSGEGFRVERLAIRPPSEHEPEPRP